jgi:hypothetical protein
MSPRILAALGMLWTVLVSQAQVWYPSPEYPSLDSAMTVASEMNVPFVWITQSSLSEPFPDVSYSGEILPVFPEGLVEVPAQTIPSGYAGATFRRMSFRMTAAIPDSSSGPFGTTVAADMSFIDCHFIGVLANHTNCMVYGDRALTITGGDVTLSNCYFDNEDWPNYSCEGLFTPPISNCFLLINDNESNTSVTVINPTWGSSFGGDFADVIESRILVDGNTNYTLDGQFLSCVFPADIFPALKVQDASTVSYEAMETEADILTHGGINNFNGGRFEDCTLSQTNGIGNYTGVTFANSSLQAGTSSPKIHVNNCEFYGSWLELESNTTSSSNITNCLFDGGDMLSKAISIVGGSPKGVTCTMDHLSIVGYNQNAILLEGTLPSLALLNSILMNENAQNEVDWSAGYVTNFELDNLDVDGGTDALVGGGFQFGTVLDVDPLFVNTNYAASGPVPYTLHWKSPVQDLVAEETDFDETPGDLGWRPLYTPVELTSIPSGTPLARGHYEISDTRVLSGSNLTIQDGTVFKVAQGEDFTIRSTSGPLAIGNIDGARTGFVSSANERSASLVIQGSGYTAPTALGGLFFNNCPSTDIRFAYLDGVELTRFYDQNDESINLVATAEFRNIDGSELIMNGCTNTLVKGFHFKNSPTSESNTFHDLLIALGETTVAHNTFETHSSTSWYAALIVASTTKATVESNTFIGTNGGDEDLCYQAGGLGVYRNNKFELFTHTPFSNNLGAVKMTENAHNEFLAHEDGFGNSVIHTYSGLLEMYCGYNRFVNSQAEYESNPFVSHAGTPDAPIEWSKNYWGPTAEQPILCDALNGDANLQTDGFVPWWADASNCLADYDPQIYYCPEDNEPDELYTSGYDAMLEEDRSAAIWYFKELIRLYPNYGDTPDATEYLKALGQKAPEYLSPAKAGLLQGAASAWAVQAEWLSATQFCYAQCVEAYYGDREGAEAVLDSCVTYGSSTLKDVAALAILEIATYPEQGGNEAVGDQVALQRSVAREYTALKALVAWRPGAPAVEPTTVILPTTFQLGRIYPNPFNPRTTIELAVAQAGQIRVTVVNLLGQQVAVLADGRLDAGTHRLSFDGAALATGVYFVRAEQGSRVDTAKVLLVK